MSSQVITTSVQEAIISDNLNSSMMLNFLMGIYTMVYFHTAYLYLTSRRPTSRSRIVLYAITVLYICCLCFTSIQWYFLQWSMVNNGATRESTFDATLLGPIWIGVVTRALSNVMLVVADGLLVWRCFHLWNRSWWIVLPPLLLTLAEIGLFIPLIYYTIFENPTLFNALSSSAFCISAAATTISTALIGYKIYNTTGHTRSKAKTQFMHIFYVILESAAAYSIVNICEAVVVGIPSAQLITATSTQAGVLYVSTLLPIVAGIAPTILVSRIIIGDYDSPPPSTVGRISGLQFQSAREGDHSVVENVRSRREAHMHMDDLESGNRVLEKSMG